MDGTGRSSPRARVRARLDGMLTRLVGGAGHVLVLAGEVGSGRTELVRAAVTQSRGIAVARGGGAPDGEHLGAWTRAAASLSDGGEVLAALLEVPVTVTGSSRVSDAPGAGTSAPRATVLRWRARLLASLRDRADREPVLWVLDDIDRADRASVDLLAWLAPQLSSLAVGVLATAEASSTVVVHGVDLGRFGEVVLLGGLTPEELAPVLEVAAGRPVPEAVLAVVHRRTGGNPRFAADLVRGLADRDELDPEGAAGLVPDVVRQLVDRRLARSSPVARRLVEAAAVLGTSGDDSALAALVPAPVASLDDLGLVRRSGGKWAFSHEVVRDAVLEVVPVAQRERLSDMGAERLAEAAERATDAGEPEGAVALLRRAVDLLPDTSPDTTLQPRVLVGLGDALRATGRSGEARQVHAAAAKAARGVDPVLLARAVLGVGSGPSGFEVPLLDRAQLDLLEDALDALPAGLPGWEARLRARLAVALTHGDQEARRRDLADRAVELARQAGDREVLAACLAARCDVLAGPDHCEEREDAATEVVALARGGDPVLELLGHRLRLVARLEQGDRVGAESDLDAFQHRSTELGDPMVTWYPPLWQAARHLLYGRVDEAARREEEARRIGAEAGSDNARFLTATHRWWALVEQGDREAFADEVDALDTLDDMPPAPWVRVALALGFAETGRSNAAMVQLDAVTDALGDLPEDSEWLPMLNQVAHVVGLVGQHPIADPAYDLLQPHGHRYVVEGIGAVWLGSVERPLGLLAAARGDREAAAGHFAAAVAANRRLGGVALVARTLRDAGVALDDPARLAEAAVLYDEVGFGRRVAEVRDRVRALGGAEGRAGTRVVAPHGTFRQEPDGWVVGWQDTTVRVRDVKGLHDLARLLDRPGRDVPALDLVAADAGPGGQPHRAVGAEAAGVEGDLGPVLDDEARRAYRARLAELEGEVERARTDNDPVAAERAVRERDALVEALTQAYGLGGRPRRSGDAAERARTTVTSRIRDAIARVGQADPALGRHLDNAVRTGRLCSYRPEMPVRWDR
nr:AAA family ATPase [Salsipaludibacter albus]